MKSTTYQVGILESIPIFETKHLKVNRLQNDHRIQNKFSQIWFLLIFNTLALNYDKQ